MYTKDAKIVMIGFDVTNIVSLHGTQKYFDVAKESLKEPEHTVFVGVGNKIDLVKEREVSTEEARSFF